jgi:hypothetical protein
MGITNVIFLYAGIVFQTILPLPCLGPRTKQPMKINFIINALNSMGITNMMFCNASIVFGQLYLLHTAALGRTKQPHENQFQCALMA